MTNVIVRHVPGSETEVGMGVMAATPPHWLIAWGEYATDGEADGEIRVMAAISADGEDFSESIASLIAGFLAQNLNEASA